MSLICRIFGHTFSPRYSEVRYETKGADGSSQLDLRTRYEGEVCRCGETISTETPDIAWGDCATASIPLGRNSAA